MYGSAEIAGAGFAGLTLATALAQRGWNVRVHERAASPRPDGTGIFLWTNGVRALSALGIEERALARAHRAPAWEERDEHDADIGRRALSVEEGTAMVTLTRRDLHEPLLAAAVAAGVELRTGSPVTRADPAGALVTADGRRWPADVAVGADGIHSRVRGSLGLLEDHRTFDELVVLRFVVPRRLAPGRDGRWANYVDHFDLARQRRVLYVPCNDDDLYLLLAARPSDTAATTYPLDPDVWCASFPALAPVLSALPPRPHRDRYQAVTVRSWSSGRAALLGDAAHAMPPTIGQGAGTAMTNALELAVALDRAPAVERALATWERTARPATDATQAVSIARVQELFPVPGRRRDSWGHAPLEAARRGA